MTKVTTDGRKEDEVPASEKTAGAPSPIDQETGQHKSYWILSEQERAKGFIRPVRRSYLHKTCGVSTVMSLSIAETYARNPKFYGATFCIACKIHRPVNEFIWEDGSNQTLGD